MAGPSRSLVFVFGTFDFFCYLWHKNVFMMSMRFTMRCLMYAWRRKKDTKKKYKIEKISAMRCRGLFSDTS